MRQGAPNDGLADAETFRQLGADYELAGHGKAGGDAVFVNRSDRQILVPKGTIVGGSGVRFVTQLDLAVPATQVGGVQKRIGVSRVAVVAEVGGTAGGVDDVDVGESAVERGLLLAEDHDEPAGPRARDEEDQRAAQAAAASADEAGEGIA